MDEKDKGVSRRHFIETAALTGAGLTILPRHVLGKGFTPPSDLLNIATVGIGGMGHNNTMAIGSQNLVAICDVDWDYAQKSIDRYANQLYRGMRDGVLERADQLERSVSDALRQSLASADLDETARVALIEQLRPRLAASDALARELTDLRELAAKAA